MYASYSHLWYNTDCKPNFTKKAASLHKEKGTWFHFPGKKGTFFSGTLKIGPA